MDKFRRLHLILESTQWTSFMAQGSHTLDFILDQANYKKLYMLALLMTVGVLSSDLGWHSSDFFEQTVCQSSDIMKAILTDSIP